MAKAKYHKSQRVFVKPVGTWAHVEAVVPKWVKGCDEPIKVAYDCGMGREFAQEELEEESTGLLLSAGKAAAEPGASYAARIGGRARSSARITPTPVRILPSSPLSATGAAGGFPAPNTISILTASSVRPS
jgi:hypothetical protein